jgi:hypothetical protein
MVSARRRALHSHPIPLSMITLGLASLLLALPACSAKLEGGGSGVDEERAPFGAYSGPGSKVEFKSFPGQKDAQDPGTWGPLLTEIERHLPASYGTTYRDADPVTHGHETTHGIDAELQNNHAPTDGKRYEAMYVLEDRAVFVEQPKLRKAQVAPYVPQALRGSRFDLYITGQTAFDDEPLYIWEEWVAYTNGGSVGVELMQLGKWTQGSRDAVAGPLELSIYAIALARAVEQHDANYFATNKQFREFLAWNLWRAMKVFHVGKRHKDFQFTSQKKLYDALLSPDGKPIRDFVRKLYGADFAFAVFYNVSLDPGGSPGTPTADAGAAPASDSGATPTTDSGAPAPQDAGSAPASDAGAAPPPPSGPDADGDGVLDSDDRCSHTRAGDVAWKVGEFAGCAAGQYKDSDDADRDGVPNSKDVCPNTPLGTTVAQSGDRAGCKVESGPAPPPPGSDAGVAPVPPADAGSPPPPQADSGTPPSADEQPPMVAITAPAALEQVPLTTTIKAVVSDNVAVTKVRFLVDGKEVGQDAHEPYELTVTLAPGQRQLAIVAEDAAGNQGVGNVIVTAAAPQTDPPKDPNPPQDPPKDPPQDPPKDPNPPQDPPKDPNPPQDPPKDPPGAPSPPQNPPQGPGSNQPRPAEAFGCSLAGTAGANNGSDAASTTALMLGLLMLLARRRRR